jgi:hypothetical protein
MAVKVTYTLDDETVGRIRKLAERSRKPQSLVVREAVAHYAAREEKLAPEEQERKLALLRDYAARPPRRAAARAPQRPGRTGQDVDRELTQLRRARRDGWTRPTD